DVRLECPEAALDHLTSERRHVVVRRELRRVRHLPGARPCRAAMRPIDVDRVARWAPEELVHGNAERLSLQVEQRILDAADRLLDDRAGALARRPEAG